LIRTLFSSFLMSILAFCIHVIQRNLNVTWYLFNPMKIIPSYLVMLAK
jgi:hypothetical protein